MNIEPQQEHEWLQRLVGEWTYAVEAIMEPGQPPEKVAGSESVRSRGETQSWYCARTLLDILEEPPQLAYGWTAVQRRSRR